MHDCVVKLLKNHDEESLECLCRLLTTIGKDLDFEKAKVDKQRAPSKSRTLSVYELGYSLAVILKFVCCLVNLSGCLYNTVFCKFHIVSYSQDKALNLKLTMCLREHLLIIYGTN